TIIDVPQRVADGSAGGSVKISLVYSAYPGRATGNVDPSSVRAHVTDLAGSLEQRGHAVTVDALRHDPLERMSRTIRDLDRKWSEYEPAVVPAHLRTSGLAPPSAIRPPTVLRRVPVVQTLHPFDLGRAARAPHEGLRPELA